VLSLHEEVREGKKCSLWIQIIIMKKCKRSENRILTAAALFLLVTVLLGAVPVKADPLLTYGMLPVYPQDIEDGTYEVEVRSDSTYFKMQDAELTVKDGEMKLRFAIHSLSYLYVFEGTAKEARHSEESSFIERTEEDGVSIFEISADALNKEIPCAAYSKARKRWYGRNVVIYADSLPKDALKIELPDYELIGNALEYYEEAGMVDLDSLSEKEEENAPETDEGLAPEAVRVDLDDGEYSIECNMTGGSGRASISSPTILTVRDGKAYAHLIWSSTYYDYMLIGPEKFLNQTTDGGNSTFDIPVTVLDEGMTVIADTTAMGDPVEIEYVLTFYSESIGDKGLVPQEAAKKVLVVALVVIIAGGILNYFVKRKRQ